MLRITQTIELKLRKNDSRLSRDFIKGLGLACSIHLVLLLLFRIVSLPNLDRVHPLPPIAVETDLRTDEIVVLPVVKTNPFPMKALEPPLFEHFHEMPILQLKKEPFSAKKITIDEPNLAEEKIVYHPPARPTRRGGRA